MTDTEPKRAPRPVVQIRKGMRLKIETKPPDGKFVTIHEEEYGLTRSVFYKRMARVYPWCSGQRRYDLQKRDRLLMEDSLGNQMRVSVEEFDRNEKAHVVAAPSEGDAVALPSGQGAP